MATIRFETDSGLGTFSCQLYDPTTLATSGSSFNATEIGSSGIYQGTVTATGTKYLIASGLTTIRGYVDFNVVTSLSVVPVVTLPALHVNQMLSSLATYAIVIDAKTTNLPSDPAGQSQLITAISSVGTDVTAVKAKTDLITSGGVVQMEESSSTIRLKTGSTKAKTVTVAENLSGKTLKLFVSTMDDVYYAQFTVTAANGSFTFTPSTALTLKNRDFKYAVREPSDGNNVLYDGLLEVNFAADED